MQHPLSRLLFIACLLALWLPLPLQADEPWPDYAVFHRIELGEEASAVTCLLQDTEGVLWIGSDRGLFNYDGYSVQPFFEFGTSANTHIYCGAVADSTYLYLGADNGLLVYDYRRDVYVDTGVTFPKDIRALARHGGLWWLGTLHGLYTYCPSTQQLTDVSAGLPHRTVYALLSASDGHLYVGTYNGCCRLTDPEGGGYEPVALPARPGKSNRFVNALLEDTGRGCIWIGMEGGLMKFDHRSGGGTTPIDGFGSNSVKSLALDLDNRLLAGTDNGLYVYDEQTGLEHIVHDSRSSQSLSSNIVWTILDDDEGNVWLGTDYGVSMTRRRAALRHVPLSALTGTGEGNRFYAMLRGHDGCFWFGGANGLMRFRRAGDGRGRQAFGCQWYRMDDPRFHLSHNRVRQLYEDRDHRLWVATDGGVNRYDEARRRFVSYNIVDSTHRYNANWAYSLFEDRDGRLWIATCLGGIFVVNKQALLRGGQDTYVAEQTFTTDNGLSGLFVNQMVQDRDGRVWVLLYNTANSIERIDPHTGRVTHVATGVLTSEQFPNSILSSTDGYIWIGFRGGVMRIDPANDAIRKLTFDTGGRHEVLAMTEAEGRIWVATTDGFWVADREAASLHRLNVAEQRFTALYFDRTDSLLYLGMVDGFAVASPARLLEDHSNHPLRLTALFVNNQRHRPTAREADGGVRYARRLRLPHDRRNLSFELSDLPYSSEEKSRLMYRLEESGADWTFLPPGGNRVIFGNLDYGNHRLVVSRLEADGRPGRHPYRLDIEILPPWYYTSWAKAAYALLALALLAWVVNFFRVKSRLKLVRLEKEKILEQSKAKMDFFANLSHDLKTPLSMIIAPISRLLPTLADKPEKQLLEQVQRNAMKLNALIHNGLDINRVDSGSNLLLIQSQIELVSFARSLLALYAEDPAKGKTLRFEFRSAKSKLYIHMDAIKLESILDNLLSNAVKYTPEGGRVTLALDVDDSGREVQITVADTGVGISPQDQPYVFQRFFQSSRTAGKKEGTGIGLYLVKTYTELHGGSVKLRSDEGAGTTVVLTLPVGVAADSLPVDTLSREEQAEHPQPAAGTPPLPDDAPVVLVVEDDADTADFIYQVLHARYRCRMAVNGKEGLDIVLQAVPALIISDVAMPVMDGFEMVRRIKKYVPASTVPIILLTGKTDKQTELESIRLHIDAFIAKPFEPDILLSRVEQLLSNHRTYEAKARMEAIATPKEIEAVSYDEKFLSAVTQLIEQHISDSELNVNALCEWTSTNNKQMYRKIKQLTGLTPVEYIKSIRMKKAAILLKQHKFSVAEVMYMVGFSNHSYFSKCFQNAFGVTPKQY